MLHDGNQYNLLRAHQNVKDFQKHDTENSLPSYVLPKAGNDSSDGSHLCYLPARRPDYGNGSIQDRWLSDEYRYDNHYNLSWLQRIPAFYDTAGSQLLNADQATAFLFYYDQKNKLTYQVPNLLNYDRFYNLS
jgi:hypothetical protein